MCGMYKEALHLKTKYLLYKFSFTIIFITFTPKTIPSKIYHIYIIYVYINTAVSFKSSITKIYYCCMALSLLFSILRKEHLYFGSRSSQYLCVTLCPHARKINSFPHKVQFNKSGNFSITQGKFNSYKEVRGKWHIPAYSPKQWCSNGRILFQEMKQQADIGLPTRSIHSAHNLHSW